LTLSSTPPAYAQWLDERCLCRYLRAREWDLEKAEHMVRSVTCPSWHERVSSVALVLTTMSSFLMQIRCTLAWRADYKPEEITAAEIEDQSKTGKVQGHSAHLAALVLHCHSHCWQTTDLRSSTHSPSLSPSPTTRCISVTSTANGAILSFT
jgi:hypothetical protein